MSWPEIAIWIEIPLLLGMTVFQVWQIWRTKRYLKDARAAFDQALEAQGAAEHYRDMAHRQLRAAGIAIHVIDELKDDEPPRTMQ